LVSDTPADQHRDGESLARLSKIAAGIFSRYGVDFAMAKRAGGWTNLTWRAGGLFLRLAIRRGSENLQKEAQLVAFLPPEVGYPAILETGVSDGFEWSLAEEIPGKSLGEVWQELDGDLLRGYAILLELWMLEDWLAHPEGEGPLEGWDPYRRLASLANGKGGFC
jgi:hypothetical protein